MTNIKISTWTTELKAGQLKTCRHRRWRRHRSTVKWQCDQQQQNTRHRQTKRQASGYRPVDQSASSTQQEQQNGQQSGREASRQAKDHQTNIDQQKNRTAGREASRTAERQSNKKPTSKCFTWNNGEHKSYPQTEKDAFNLS